ncbi:hypothetical protein ACEPAG_9799 [Sanghuangporus baumii]
MSTHYSLQLIRLEDLQWKHLLRRKDPKIFVELSIGNVTKRTRTAQRSRSPTWNETITFPASFESETLEIQVIHKSTLLPDSCVGVGAIDLADLLARSSAEVPLNIVSPKHGAEFTGRIFLRLSDIDVMQAVDMSIRGVAQDVRQPGIVQSADASNVAQLVNDGATQTGSHELYKAVGELLQRLEVFGPVIDALSELHPFFNIAWWLTSALYKAVKNVFEADKKVIDLVRTMSEAFLIVCDVQTLRDRAVGLQRSIDGLLKQTIECCIFIREYTSHGFVGRMLEADKSQKIDRFQRTLAKLRNDIDSGVNVHTAVVSMRAAHGVDKLLLHQYLNPGYFDAFDHCTSKVSQEDVLIYLRTEMDRAVREEVEIPKDYPWEANMEMLGNAAGGLFIWASTAVKMVENSNTKLDRLEHLVSDSRTLSGFGLDGLYAAVLSVSGVKWSDDGSKKLFRKVLGLVLLSKVPVSIGDIDAVSLFVHFLEFPLGLSRTMQTSHPFYRMLVNLHPCLPCQLC